MKLLALSGCRVDEVPFRLKPFVCLFAYSIALLGFLYCLLVHLTSNIVIIGREHLKDHTNHIYCFWHQNVFLYFAIFLHHHHHAWMQHPLWYMKPSHIFLRLIGVSKIILGSSGHSGKEAASQLVNYLKNGYSTAIMPDGPHGPPFVMKKGALHISMQSHVPVVPLRFSTSHPFELHHWDKRLWALPFSKFVVEFGRPIYINENQIDNACDLISRAMG